ncbi:MAG: hypothetical protein ACKVVP_14620 [Chloroflexota bacterium]
MAASGFLRVVTHPRVFTQPTLPSAAITWITAIRCIPGVSTLPLGGELPLVESLCQEHQLSGNDIPDAWIAATILHQHEHLVTLDRGFRRFLDRGRLTILTP